MTVTPFPLVPKDHRCYACPVQATTVTTVRHPSGTVVATRHCAAHAPTGGRVVTSKAIAS